MPNIWLHTQTHSTGWAIPIVVFETHRPLPPPHILGRRKKEELVGITARMQVAMDLLLYSHSIIGIIHHHLRDILMNVVWTRSIVSTQHSITCTFPGWHFAPVKKHCLKQQLIMVTCMIWNYCHHERKSIVCKYKFLYQIRWYINHQKLVNMVGANGGLSWNLTQNHTIWLPRQST